MLVHFLETRDTATGDRVSFEGSDYESLIAGNVWSPTGYPAGWRKL